MNPLLKPDQLIDDDGIRFNINHHYENVLGINAPYFSFNLWEMGGLVAKDFSKNENNGTISTDSDVAWGYSKIGSALIISGAASQPISFTAKVFNDSTPFSLEFLLVPTTINTGGDTFAGYSGSTASFVSIYDATTLRIRDNNSNNHDFTVPTISEGDLCHIVFTQNGSEYRCFLNGVESSTGAISNSDGFTIDEIGNGWTNNSYTLEAQHILARIYDYKLEAETIRILSEDPFAPFIPKVLPFHLFYGAAGGGTPATNLLDGKLIVKSVATKNLDGKVAIGSNATGLLDGKLLIETAAQTLLDGKLSVKSVATNLFDGKLIIKTAAELLLDGLVSVKSSTTGLFDGKLVIESTGTATDHLDGKIIVKDNVTVNLDGKLVISSVAQDTFDGLVIIKSSGTSSLDGKVIIKDIAVGLLDGKVKIKTDAACLLDGKVSVRNVAVGFLDGKISILDDATTLLDGKLVVSSDSAVNVFDGKIILQSTVQGTVTITITASDPAGTIITGSDPVGAVIIGSDPADVTITLQ